VRTVSDPYMTIVCICKQRVEIVEDLPDLSGRPHPCRLAKHTIELASFEMIKRGNALTRDIVRVPCPLSGAEAEIEEGR
jgi:hypothetical protein